MQSSHEIKGDVVRTWCPGAGPWEATGCYVWSRGCPVMSPGSPYSPAPGDSSLPGRDRSVNLQRGRAWWESGGGVHCRCMRAAPSMGVLSLGVHAPQRGFRGREPTHDVSVGTASIDSPAGATATKIKNFFPSMKTHWKRARQVGSAQPCALDVSSRPHPRPQPASGCQAGTRGIHPARSSRFSCIRFGVGERDQGPRSCGTN